MPDSDDEPTAKIGLTEVYREVLATQAMVSPLPEKVNDLVVRVKAVEDGKLDVKDYRIDRAQGISTFKDHENRLRVIEKLGNRFGGAWGIVAGVLAIGGGVMIDHLLR